MDLVKIIQALDTLGAYAMDRYLAGETLPPEVHEAIDVGLRVMHTIQGMKDGMQTRAKRMVGEG